MTHCCVIITSFSFPWFMQHVRRAAVSALSTFAHYKPNLIKGLLPELLPLLYDQTVIKVNIFRRLFSD